MNAVSKRKTPPPPEEPQPLALTEVELLRLDRGLAEQRAITAETNLLLRERMDLLAKIDPQGILKRLDAEIQKRKAEMASSRQRHEEVSATIEKRLGVKLAEYSFDDVTGTLHHLGSIKSEEV